MPEPLQLPIRVLVKGPSNVCWMSFPGGPRADFTFPRALEAELLEAGRPSTVRAITVPSEQAKATLRRWEAEVLGFSPDVIVLTYGHYESVHLFLPHWLERHANSLKARPGFFRERYREYVLRPVWTCLARQQARADRSRIAGRTKSVRARRTVRDIARFVENVQQVSSPLVIIFQVPPPAQRAERWFPGMRDRIAEYNRLAAEYVQRLDRPNVRFFRVTELIEQHAGGNLEAAIPDGFHWTPRMHAIIGGELAREIIKWADTQPHLRVSDV